MADKDVRVDTTPQLQFQAKPIAVSALKTAITGSGVASHYPASFLQSASKNDLLYVCKLEGITITNT